MVVVYSVDYHKLTLFCETVRRLKNILKTLILICSFISILISVDYSKQVLLEAGAYANAQAKDGVTPFLLAASMFHLEAMRALVEAGADVNAKNKDGATGQLMVTHSRVV